MNEVEFLNMCLQWHTEYKQWVSDRKDGIFKDPIRYYCGEGYKAIDLYCRGKDSNHTLNYRNLLRECVDEIEYWLKKAPILEQDIILYRVVYENEFKELLKYKINYYVSFLSTTIISDREIMKKTFNKEYIFKIKVPKGTVCPYIEPLSSTGQKKEKEVLFPRNTTLSMSNRCFPLFCGKELECILNTS